MSVLKVGIQLVPSHKIASLLTAVARLGAAGCGRTASLYGVATAQLSISIRWYPRRLLSLSKIMIFGTRIHGYPQLSCYRIEDGLRCNKQGLAIFYEDLPISGMV